MEVLAGGRLAAHHAVRTVLGHEDGGASLGMQDRCALGLGGVGLVNILILLFCHSYMEGRKQAEKRKQAIPEVSLKMEFLQQVKVEEKQVQKGKAQPKNEAGQDDTDEEEPSA